MFLALHKHYSRYPDDDANAAQEALRAAKEATERAAREREESQQLADVSVASFANTTSSAGAPNGGKQLVGILKTGGTGTAKKVKPKLTAKEKKERIINSPSCSRRGTTTTPTTSGARILPGDIRSARRR